MISLDILFITLPLTIIFGSPLYLLFRHRMGKPEKKIKFTNAKIMQFTILIFLISMPILLQCIGIFILLTSQSSENVIFTVLFILSLLIAFYGTGFYVSALILETINSHSILSFFHGTLSHILIHWGAFFAFLSLVILSQNYVPKLIFSQQLMIVIWGIAGFFHALSQIFNKTAYFQLIGALLCLTSFFVIMGDRINTVGTYFLSFFVIFNSVLFTYLFIKK